MPRKTAKAILNYKIETVDSSLLEVLREDYQKPLNEKRVAQIVAAFDENIANEPKVSYRDGHYYVFDGQHTVTRGQAAAMLARLVDPAQRLQLYFQSFSQFRDILGVDPAAVLLMVDGADFTAEDCSEALYQGLRKQ